MASGQKVGWAKLRVGVMALAALVVLGILIFLMTGTKNLFSKKATLYTYMDDSAALAPSSPVRINGIIAGKVKKVALSGETEPRRIIRVDLEVERDLLSQIPIDSVASISAENVLGAKFINIKKGQNRVAVQPGAEIQSLDTREFDEVVQQGYALLASLQGILTRVDKIVGFVENGQGSIGKLLVDEELYKRMLLVTSDVQKVTHALTTPQGTVGKLIYDDALYGDIRTSMGRLDSLLAGLQQGQGTAGRILKDEALYQDVRASVRELQKLIADLNAGKGTAGKLLKSDELHDQIRAAIAKVDLIIDKINAGHGTIGQLLVNPQLYDTLNGATSEMQQLLKDIRANPKKFLRVKLALF